jgi:hypothetical protein
MSVTNLVSLLTIFEETVGQGIGPNGTSGVSTSGEWEAAELAGTAVQLPHLASSLGIDSIVETEVSPEFVRARTFQTQPTETALSNVTYGFSCYLTGRGSALAAGTTATATALSRVLDNALGGVHYTETCTLAGGGHTATVVNVDDASTLAVGAVIAWEDANGLMHPRVITGIAGLAVTLNTALPSTPSDDDLMRGGATLYIDEDVICDTSSNAGSTFSACIQRGANASAGWELNGCKAELSGLQFARNEFPTAEFSVQAMRFTDPSAGPSPDMPAASYPNPQVIGPDSQIIIEDAGTTTLTTVCNGTVSVQPGVPVVPLECMADNLATTEGVGLYSITPADTLIDVDIFPYAASWHVDKAADTNKQIAVIKNGASGNCFALFAQNCEIQTVTPGTGDFTSSNLQLRAVEHNADTATTALERSKFRIFIG